jgi:hypothetical protein
MKRWCELSAFFVLVATATRLFGAPPEPVQLLVPTLGLGTAINQEFTKLTKFGITPFLAYYGVPTVLRKRLLSAHVISLQLASLEAAQRIAGSARGLAEVITRQK